jgi:hypothetical protein
MSARQLKEELSKDQINRKLDSTYERLNHRLGYLEARLDISIAKLQVIIRNISLHTYCAHDNAVSRKHTNISEVHTASVIWAMMIMEAVRTSETLVYFYETTWRYFSECNLHTCHYENLKSHNM